MNVDLPESTLAIALAHYGQGPRAPILANKLLVSKDALLFCEILDGHYDDLVVCSNAVTNYSDANQQFKKQKEETLTMCNILQKELTIEINKRNKTSNK
jgi:hypothetical protein